MTDERIPPADNQPVLEDERHAEFIPGGAPAVYVMHAEPEPNAETAPSGETAAVETGATFVGWLRGLFGGDSLEARASDLTQMIEAQPEAPANYVFRGELLLKSGAYNAAADDFRRALELAAQQVEIARWGVVVQALQDRALAGLEQAERRLNAQ